MSATNRRSFLARGAALAAVPAVAALASGVGTERASAGTLPSYAPIPRSALGPAVNAQGFYVGRVERNLYWVTDATYQAAFLTTSEGVVLFDAPRPSARTCSGPSTRSRDVSSPTTTRSCWSTSTCPAGCRSTAST